jgi:hypothetical protein
MILTGLVAALAIGCGAQKAPSTGPAKSPQPAAKPTPSQPAPAQAQPTPALPAKPPAAKPGAEKASPEKAVAEKAPDKKETPVAVDPNVKLAWDFVKLPPEKWQGVSFPGASRVKFPAGAAFTLWSSGIGPQILRVNSDASEISAIRIEVAARQTKDGRNKTPVTLSGLKVVWASPETDAAKDPYAKCPGVKLEVKDPATPNVWTATLEGAQNWKGKIARLGVVVELPKRLKAGGQDRYHIVVKKIELLK